MKKSLSVLLSATLAVGSFASVAAAADSALTPQQQFDALKAKGVLAGINGEAALDQPMTRAEWARVASLLKGLEGIGNPDTKQVSEKPFADVELGKWYTEEIAAAKEAGLISGYPDGSFKPGANLSNQEVAAALGQLLGLTPVADAQVEGASGVYPGWIKALADKGITIPTPYSAPATRELLVTGTYSANNILNPEAPEKVSVASAKATGVFKVEVQLDKEVDTSKATLTLKKGSSTVSSTTKWNDDKKSAVLSLDTRLTAGDYTVTLGGLDTATVDQASATFTAQDETVSKIEFVSATDTLPYSKYAAIEARAENQYGEAASLGSSNFTALVSGNAATIKKNADGNLVFTADVRSVGGVTQGNGIVPVTVYMNNSNVTATKNFKVGTVPLLSKIETGDVTYSNASTKKLTNVGDKATVALKLYDQYGNPIVKNQFVPYTVGADTITEVNASSISPVITPYESNIVIDKAGASLAVGDLFDDNDNAKLTVKLNGKLDKNADFTVNIYGGTSSATATVSVGASNLATKIEFDTSAVTLAANDASVLVPVIAYDANGNKLSAQDIADNYAAVPSRFTFSATNGTTKIVQTGADKGKLLVTFGGANTVGSRIYISGQINQSLTNTYVQTNIPVGDTRIADHITVATENAPKAILGADDAVDFQLKDQYGSDIGNLSAQNIAGVNGQTAEYQVVVDVVRSGTGVSAAPVSAPVGGFTHPDANVNIDRYVYPWNELSKVNAGWNLTSTGAEGKVVVKATIQKKSNGAAAFSDYSSTVSRSFESIKSDSKLTFSLDTVGSLYAAEDKLAGAAYDSLAPQTSQFAKKLAVIATDASGAKVKLPENYVKSLSVSDPTVVDASVKVATDDGYLLGFKAGTATVTAIVYTNAGNTVSLSQDITVKADPIVVDSISADNTSKTLTLADWADLTGSTTYAYQLFNHLTVKDQYGIEYKDGTINTYDAVLGVRYTVQTLNGTGNVTIDAKTGKILTISAGVKEFQITALAPNGKTVTFVAAKGDA